MRVLLTSDARFERTPDGAIWGAPAYGRDLWTRYLNVFSPVLVAARVVDVSRPSAGCVVASQPDLHFWRLPAYSRLAGLLGDLPQLHASLAAAVEMSHAIIVRAPSSIAYLAARAAIRAGRSFGAEIVGDADQVFARGAFRHPLRGAIRVVAAAAERQISRRAAAVLYVTSEVLQRRYPTTGRSYAASDGALDDSAFSSECQREWSPQAGFVLVTVGGLDQPFKGTAVLLDAMSTLRRRQAAVKLRIVGGGRLMPQFQRLCDSRGLSAHVEFLGQRDLAGVREALDSAHLFVLPSLTEGLPRALLEAMARGLPAVATNVGGIPELLPADCLVPPGDARALAARIEAMMADPAARRTLGERNRAHALTHHESRQAIVRGQFLDAVRAASASDCAPRTPRRPTDRLDVHTWS